MKRTNKIKVAVSPDQDIRRKMIQRIVVDMGFAVTPGDAGKIIRVSPHEFDLYGAYFVFADTYNFRESPITRQRLFELAATGTAVVVGARRIPPEMEFMCEAYHPHDFGL